MKNNVQAKTSEQLSVQEISEKYNRGKKIIDFIGHKKIFFCVSIAVIVIGIICNIIFGATLDIQFSGGTEMRFSYTGEIEETELTEFIQGITDDRITTSYSSDILGDTANTVTVQFSGQSSLDTDIQSEIETSLKEQFPDSGFTTLESNSIDASMGFSFLMKCIVAVIIASILMVIYVTVRFKKIGGLSAGVMGLAALFHDVAMIYFLYVIFRMPIDSNFIAVVLMILGYSLNDTIVVYDRVREDRKLVGRKSDIATVFNLSASQTIKRTIITSVTTLTAIVIVYIMAVLFNIPSVQSFALPMMIGIISGCYSSLCIAGPLWVMWQNHKTDVNKSKGGKKAKA